MEGDAVIHFDLATNDAHAEIKAAFACHRGEKNFREISVDDRPVSFDRAIVVVRIEGAHAEASAMLQILQAAVQKHHEESRA